MLIGDYYWSSNESYESAAIVVNFETGILSDGVKGASRFRVRPIRYF